MKPLRLWPGVVIAILVAFLWWVVPVVAPDAFLSGVLAAMAGAVLIVGWWLFFSRAPWAERIAAIVLIALSTFLLRFVVHPSLVLLAPAIALPATVLPLFVLALVLARHLTGGRRWATIAAAVIAGAGIWTVLRMDGINGYAQMQLHWRWTPTVEQRLLAQANDEPQAVTTLEANRPEVVAAAPSTNAPAPARAADPAMDVTGGTWPGFRGAERNSVISDARVSTDWQTSPPKELWRRSIGPAWSSFAVEGGLVFTQEQRGEFESVSAYRLRTGETVWRHRDRLRFSDAGSGAGPRATPAVHGRHVYTLGATGIVNALDANSGRVIWSRNAQADTGAQIPEWGFAGSPLVVGDLLVIATSGRLVAYERTTGAPRWTRTTSGGGFSSPHAVTVTGVPQVLLLNGGGISGVAPSDGSLLWEYTQGEGFAIVQPSVLSNGDLLIAAAEAMAGIGIQRIAVSQANGVWTVNERWRTRGLKPYFNDYVVHKDHAYGFDGTILSCIDLADGERRWKGGRYGAGQMLLFAGQDLLLVLSEDGEVALVRASPDRFREVAKFKAIEGKTWNHPVLVGDILLVRNGEEMAAFRLNVRR